MTKKTSEDSVSFEETLEELENLVNEMEQGDLPLNDALEKFERGIVLAKQSQKALENAEQKVKILMQSQTGETLVDLEASEQTDEQ
ncbi:exodeoxyribonuclease VII small subunit [Alteromonas sediminis]|uniref:Exodeoxyribonuclease 7 small subunit n=1 Tax=Alteromonas sediminis TaxID=2259342 RepID=A0A3N5YA52_9ALTE|nr:exodeoxyribonuclease VII small subunit [Alteromonas sediminis]RPJ65575.1 exodeoxyribonuclease VII small subunit [Alteromonas sediminis]